jgi:hypothetical protein
MIVKVLWFLGFGLLPFWVAVAYVIVKGSGAGVPSEYWAAAPWLVFTAIPFCAITLTVATLTYGAYTATSGDPSQKLKRAGASFGLLLCVVLAGVGFFWNRHAPNKTNAKAEQETGRLLVENSDLVKSAAPPRFEVSLSSSTFDGSRLTYYVRSPDSSTDAVMAIVDVSRNSGQPELHLACVVSQREYHNRDAMSDPCEPQKDQPSRAERGR